MKTLSAARFALSFALLYSAAVNPINLNAKDVPQRFGHETAKAGSTMVFDPILFRGGELALVTVKGDGGTKLDLYIYDAAGNLVAKDEEGYVTCIGIFVPPRAGYYYVEVVNRGWYSNRFDMATN